MQTHSDRNAIKEKKVKESKGNESKKRKRNIELQYLKRGRKEFITLPIFGTTMSRVEDVALDPKR